MTKEAVLQALHALSIEQQLEWLHDLGMMLTISARSNYSCREALGSIDHLIGWNELQHAMYGQLQHLRFGNAWSIESFMDGLIARAQQYGIEGDFVWALKLSVDRLTLK